MSNKDEQILSNIDEQILSNLEKFAETEIQKKARISFLCRFLGEIVPRAPENQLQYVGGDTKLTSVDRDITFSGLLKKVSEVSGLPDITIKYNFTKEVDGLMCVTNDEDVERMMREYEVLVPDRERPDSPRLRLYLFDNGARLMCSYGGTIFPGPGDEEELGYIGGDSRVIVVPHGITLSGLLHMVSAMFGSNDITTIQYELPNQDLDNLVSLTNDEDVEIMMEEYDEFAQRSNPELSQFRLFLFDSGVQVKPVHAL